MAIKTVSYFNTKNLKLSFRGGKATKRLKGIFFALIIVIPFFIYFQTEIDGQDIVTPKQMTPLIVDKLVNWGYEEPPSTRLIDTIIIHSCYNALGRNPYSVKGVIYEYKIYGVSPHYLINRNGNIFRLVKEENIAYHTGGGKMPDGRSDINSFSIGIELINTKTVGPNKTQYSSLVALVKSLKLKYEIKNILGHNEISLERKTDPWNFDWQKFNVTVS